MLISNRACLMAPPAAWEEEVQAAVADHSDRAAAAVQVQARRHLISAMEVFLEEAVMVECSVGCRRADHLPVTGTLI